ncbi:MAG: hypothetical protein E7299_08460 [Lachnospiraceae bacterium]|nr:hypothetical protein [Lachnospiraceae bacterium]
MARKTGQRESEMSLLPKNKQKYKDFRRKDGQSKEKEALNAQKEVINPDFLREKWQVARIKIRKAGFVARPYLK